MPTTSAGPVVVVGEALVDVAFGRDGIEHRMPGGSPMNVAVGIAKLGVPATLLSSFGNDDDGMLIGRHLESAGVVVADGAMRVGERTSTAYAHLADDGAAVYEFDLRWELSGEQSVPAGAIALHTGSIATVLEPGAERVLEIFNDHPDSVLRSFDPNVRPAITPDRKAVLERVEQFGRNVDILKLSDEDAQWLLPGADDRMVEEWAFDLGVRLFAMTRGADGCVLATADHRIEQAGIPSNVVDTIGAGDAFMSALIVGTTRWDLARQLSSGGLSAAEIEALASLAQQAASVTVARAGATPPTWKELQAASKRSLE